MELIFVIDVDWLYQTYPYRSGEEVYGKTRLRASFMASPWTYNNRLSCLSEKGKTFVIKPGPEFEILHEDELDGICLATPAIARGKLFIRTDPKLYCITRGED